jgi:hypothetical protein
MPKLLSAIRYSNEDADLSPLWRTFQILRGELERFVVLNFVWALQFAPGVITFAFQEWPLLFRIILFVYSAITVIPATLTVYGLAKHSSEGETIGLELARDILKKLILPSFYTFAPLVTTIIFFVWILFVLPANLVMIAVLLRVILLGFLASATYWGPLFTEKMSEEKLQPSALALATQSFKLMLRHPLTTLASALVSLFALALATVSIGGLFLVAMVFLALYQVQSFNALQSGKETAHE